MNELIAAIYTRLTGQLSASVYDHVPQDTSAYPYVVIRVVQADNQDTDTEIGNSVILRVSGYSRYRGFSELMSLADDITTALNNWDIADTTSYKVGTVKEQFKQFLVDDDGLTRYSVQQYIFYFEPI